MSDSFDKSLENTLLDIKALMLLAGQDSDNLRVIKSTITGSNDQNIMEFRKLMESDRNSKELLYVSIGEFFLSAFLIVVSIFTMIPSFFIFVDPSAVRDYFSTASIEFMNNNPEGYAVFIFMFGFSLIMMFIALHTLRLAGENMQK
ncbi:MAG: hypothetical protein ACP5UV_05540 [Thermoplasmata archaeon]